MRSISIVIPVHQETPDSMEVVSFLQCLKILGNYPFALVYPEGLNIDFYESHFISSGVQYTLEAFDANHFADIDRYNYLMLNPEFYQRFIHKDFILVYQLDSFIFRDEIKKWCGFDYDYIGAPLTYLRNENLCFKGVGNGGFSLRKPDKLIEYLATDSLKMNFSGFRKLYAHHSWTTRVMQVPKILIRLAGYRNRGRYFFNQTDINEDYVFGFISQHSNHKLNIPQVGQAMQFAFDKHPEMLYKLNDNRLPFGCHGWYKPASNLEFWKQYIPLP